MSVKTEMLGGHLPLLDPQALSIGQKEIDIIYLTGIYHIVCALLNAFEIPVPGSEV